MSRGPLGPVASGLGLVVMLAAAPAVAEAQVFLASRPHPGLAVTPLFIVASVGSDASDVPVEVLFSLMIPPDTSALDLEQDLYLLWPGEVVGTGDGDGGIELPPDVAAQVTVIARGRLPLRARRHYESSADAEPLAPGAPYVSVVRTGGPLGRSPAATYVRIPWTPRCCAWSSAISRACSPGGRS
jgi:hypothetical protein